MAITQQQIQDSEKQQFEAAHDPGPQVRLIAGPGSGKSFTIQERVDWLLSKEVMPNHIFVISFTRASTLDLRNNINKYCQRRGHPNACYVSISTLHSLALKILRFAGLLTYPVDPIVLDDWELKKIFDAEFSKESKYLPTRCKEIREEYDAYCGPGSSLHPNYIVPEVPLTPAERQDYQKFHGSRTQIYSCVLPGEIVRQCVTYINAGTINPTEILGTRHLIVDEYQDLNPSDLEFIDSFIANGVDTFVAGDDDQSIYSFRYASPAGIQTFVSRFPKAGQHELKNCFRCTPHVLKTAQSLINNFSEPSRIPKNLESLYATSTPPNTGIVHRWKFYSSIQEARSISESCRDLIESQIPPQDIMILLSNTKAQLSTLIKELDKTGVIYEPPRDRSLLDTNHRRFFIALLRCICEPDDYFAHRLILGLPPHIGPGICNNIANLVSKNNLNYRDLFYNPLPLGIFKGPELTALNNARAICAEISNWQPSDTLHNRLLKFYDLMNNIYGQQISEDLINLFKSLPKEMTIEELRNYLWADTDEQRIALLKTIYDRLNLEFPDVGLLEPKVRIMTMHGAKGLNASIVFIPGLMEEILPGEHRIRYPGLVLESARMLYVSITRARATCILSYAKTRIVNGKFSKQIPSRFTAHLSGQFIDRTNGLNANEIESIKQSYDNL